MSNTPGLSILVLEYTLAWASPYPTQLRQGVEALSYVIHTLQKVPSQVCLAGDSAGGNLVLGVLSHLLHPHPELPSLRLQGSIGGAIMISPWVSFCIDYPSMTENARKDNITEHINVTWSQTFLGGKKSDEYAEPLRAHDEWWSSLKSIVNEILITAGDDEYLRDSIKAFADRLEVSRTPDSEGHHMLMYELFQHQHPKATFLVAQGEMHIQPLMVQPRDEVGTTRDAIFAFCRSRL